MAGRPVRRPAHSGSRSGLPEDPSNRLQQVPHADRLAPKAIEARGHDFLPLLGHPRSYGSMSQMRAAVRAQPGRRPRFSLKSRD